MYALVTPRSDAGGRSLLTEGLHVKTGDRHLNRFRPLQADEAGDGLPGHALAEQPDNFFELERRHLANSHGVTGLAGCRRL